MAEEKNELALLPKNYLALSGDTGKVAQVIKGNLRGRKLSPFNLDRVTVPTGGATVFMVPSLEGPQPTSEITGIMVAYENSRSYWEHGLDEGGEAGPPDCFSIEDENGGATGIGKFHGRECEGCPMNQFGTGRNGRGKACKEKEMLYILRPNSYIPLVIQVPVMSLGPMQQYMMRLSNEVLHFWEVITTISLEVAQQSGGGLKYSKIAPRLAARLAPEDIEKVRAVKESFGPLLGASPQRDPGYVDGQTYNQDNQQGEEEVEDIAF